MAGLFCKAARGPGRFPVPKPRLSGPSLRVFPGYVAMSSPPISQQTEERIALLFPLDWQRVLVRTILSEQCGSNLPLMKSASEAALERLQFAALKLSEGNLDRL